MIMMMNQPAARKPDSGIVLVQAELVSSMAWLIDIRWLAGLGVLGAAWLIDIVFRFPLPIVPLYLIGTAILVYNAVFQFILGRLLRNEQRDIRQFDYLTKVQIGCDWLAMTALIHFSGGVASPVIFYFFFHIVIAAMLLTPRATFAYAAVATLLVGATVWLEYAEIVPHVYVLTTRDDALYHDPLFMMGVVFFFASAMFVAAYLASTLSNRLRKR